MKIKLNNVNLSLSIGSIECHESRRSSNSSDYNEMGNIGPIKFESSFGSFEIECTESEFIGLLDGVSDTIKETITKSNKETKTEDNEETKTEDNEETTKTNK